MKKIVISYMRKLLNKWRSYKSYKRQLKEVHDRLTNRPQPDLNENEKVEIDTYWSKYGIKFKDYSWFRWYYGITGIRSPKFLPDVVYYDILIPYYNEKDFVQAYKDKNCFDMYMPSVSFPPAVLKRIGKDFCRGDGTYISYDGSEQQVIDILSSEQQVIVKNSRDTADGKSVKKYNINSPADAKEIINEWNREDFIIQKVVKQHPFFEAFNESSVNIMRINSWYHNGKIYITAPLLRFGLPGKNTDVCFINGEEIVRFVGITPDGFLRDKVLFLDGTSKELVDVAAINIGKKVPCWDSILDLIVENAPRLKHIKMIGWDVTVSEDEKPIVIEYNIKLPAVYSCQLANGPMYGDMTDEVLCFLRDEINQKKYIPKWMRFKKSEAMPRKQ